MFATNGATLWVRIFWLLFSVRVAVSNMVSATCGHLGKFFSNSHDRVQPVFGDDDVGIDRCDKENATALLSLTFEAKVQNLIWLSKARFVNDSNEPCCRRQWVAVDLAGYFALLGSDAISCSS